MTRVLGRDGRPDAGSVVVFDVGFGGAEDEFVDELTATMSLTHDLHVYRSARYKIISSAFQIYRERLKLIGLNPLMATAS